MVVRTRDTAGDTVQKGIGNILLTCRNVAINMAAKFFELTI